MARERRIIWNHDADFEKVQLSMEISDLIYQIGRLRNREDFTRPVVGRAYAKSKKRLMEIMEMPI